MLPPAEVPTPALDPQPPAIDFNLPSPTDAPPQEAPTQEAPTHVSFPLSQVEVVGNTVLQAEIRAITSQLENQQVTFADLLQLRSDITQLYIDNGYITSGAFLPNNQDLSDGQVANSSIRGVPRKPSKLLG